MSALSQTTTEYDTLTLNTILVKGTSNTIVPPFHSLISDGQGGAYWSTIREGTYADGFKGFSTSAASYIPDKISNKLILRVGGGLGYALGPTSVNLYAEAFQTMTIPGLSSISTLSTVYFSTVGNAQMFISNNTLNYQILDTAIKVNSNSIKLNSTTNFIGINGIYLSTQKDNIIGIQMPFFTSTSFSSMKSEGPYLESNLFNTLLPTYVPRIPYYSSFITQLSSQLFESTLNYMSINRALSTIIYNQLSSSTFSLEQSNFLNFSSRISSFYPQSLQNYSTLFSTFYRSTGIETLIVDSFASENFKIINADAVSTASTTISLFNSRAKGIDGRSTVIGLEKRLIQVSTNLYYYQVTNNSTFAETQTNFWLASTVSTVNRVNLWQTVPFTIYTDPAPAKGFGYDTLLSTCELQLSSLITKVDSNSQIFIDYAANYKFLDFHPYLRDTFTSYTQFTCTAGTNTTLAPASGAAASFQATFAGAAASATTSQFTVYPIQFNVTLALQTFIITDGTSIILQQASGPTFQSTYSKNIYTYNAGDIVQIKILDSDKNYTLYLNNKFLEYGQYYTTNGTTTQFKLASPTGSWTLSIQSGQTTPNILSANIFPTFTTLRTEKSTVPSAYFEDYMTAFMDIPSNMYSLESYSKSLRIKLDTNYYLSNYSTPYIFNHYHSNIMFINNDLAQKNPQGGIVSPSYFTQNCAGLSMTESRWTNLMSSNLGVKVFVYNALVARQT
jgi:hypothetical protein